MSIFEPETKPKEKPTPQFLRKRQVDELKSDERTLERYLGSPAIQDKGAVKAQLTRVQRALREQTPPKMTPLTQDKIVARGKELEEKIAEGMPSSEEMRKNPPGAVGKHMRWEKKNKVNIMEWKNTQIAMNQGSDDPDLANVERLRPATSTLNMHGAQIAGQDFNIPSTQYMDNYDRVFSENKELLKENLALKVPKEETTTSEEE